MKYEEDKFIDFILNYKYILEILGSASVIGLGFVLWDLLFNTIVHTTYDELRIIYAKIFVMLGLIYVIALLIFVIILWVIGFDVLYFLRCGGLSIDIPSCFGEMDNTTNCHKCKHIKRCKEYKES